MTKPLSSTVRTTPLVDAHAIDLAAAEVRRVKISCDTSHPDLFHLIKRTGNVEQRDGGITAGNKVGLAVEVTMVALKDFSEDKISPMPEWCIPQGHDPILIEAALRDGGIADALAAEPRRHDFRIGASDAPALARHMGLTGG